jgi:hypothetical protein
MGVAGLVEKKSKMTPEKAKPGPHPKGLIGQYQYEVWAEWLDGPLTPWLANLLKTRGNDWEVRYTEGNSLVLVRRRAE